MCSDYYGGWLGTKLRSNQKTATGLETIQSQRTQTWCKRRLFCMQKNRLQELKIHIHQMRCKQRSDAKRNDCKARKHLQTKCSKSAGGALSRTAQLKYTRADQHQLTTLHFQITAGPHDFYVLTFSFFAACSTVVLCYCIVYVSCITVDS